MARIPISYAKLSRLLAPGDKLTTDDGRVGLQVKKVKGNDIHCVVLYGKVIKPNRGVNVPFVDEKFPIITDRDLAFIPQIVPKKPDMVAISFVRNVKNVIAVREALDNAGGEHIRLIAKIEMPEAVDCIKNILKSDATDGVMVARGDLAYEGLRSDLLFYSLRIIREAQRARKDVIMATQMLSSMEHNWVPTRAEMTDVSLAVSLGVNGVMTSGETAQGEHPIEVVEIMQEFVQAAEKSRSKIRKLLKDVL